mmetsp:Transcript_36938/g.27307  ORF Transcript_36938/g.27307 Transcript_36938/m.27307 type:complete len:80 (-) Transcript_36938:368-607(-)|eukprot:CAMPEP_0202965330 /NCGR_PEP_ID=MMETSP1396-20130829/9342_1 /ASSEMBLY_ACC=CAM_ASM_000872 /TAXON_ID= /ORGANISM="Pseudokeronopsis sp., Strain Brazil" /LENGTH=79 /DNA_ID=CAMNT_0049688007 /DNA_START=91 /DNA_END=330 /DNA_ORIENTATION=+
MDQDDLVLDNWVRNWTLKANFDKEYDAMRERDKKLSVRERITSYKLRKESQRVSSSDKINEDMRKSGYSNGNSPPIIDV